MRSSSNLCERSTLCPTPPHVTLTRGSLHDSISSLTWESRQTISTWYTITNYGQKNGRFHVSGTVRNRKQHCSFKDAWIGEGEYWAMNEDDSPVCKKFES